MSNTDKTELVLPMIYGICLHVPFYYGLRVFSHWVASSAPPGPPPLWYMCSFPMLAAIAATAPAFVAGWLSRRFAFVLGAAIGFLASAIEQPLIDLHWSGGAIGWPEVLRIAAYALSPAIVSSVACAAGQFARAGFPAPAAAAPPAPVAGRSTSGK